jgi:hypothetical protein
MGLMKRMSMCISEEGGVNMCCKAEGRCGLHDSVAGLMSKVNSDTYVVNTEWEGSDSQLGVS